MLCRKLKFVTAGLSSHQSVKEGAKESLESRDLLLGDDDFLARIIP